MARRTTRKRIGYGSFDIDNNENSKVWLRNEFLETIEKLEPEKLRKPFGDLAAQPFEEYVSYREKQDRKSISRRRQVSERLKQQSGKTPFFSLLNEDDPLRESIRQWAEKYNLNSVWCYELAMSTLQHWHEFKETTRKGFKSLPFYGHPNYLGFGSLVSAYNFLNTPLDSLDKDQKELINSVKDSFSEQDKKFVEFFNEQQRIYMSFYPHDPHIRDDNHFNCEAKRLIENTLPAVNYALPVLNLLSRADRVELHKTLHRRAKQLLKRINEYARTNSEKLIQVGTDEISKHLKWAVRYQVFEEGYSVIAGNKYNNQRDKHTANVNVRKQVNKILNLVDLDPRPATKRP